ncbi:MAG: ABC transporter substrate-binding protein [Clostridia bacterium]|nr:ABC transporter substrate-binding protein [Clostridia bacterium]
MKKLIALVLSLMMVLSLAATASANVIDPALVPEKTGEITVYLYGDKTPRMQELCNNEFAKVFLEEINCVVNVEFIPWSEYGTGNMTDRMILSGGEDFDTTLTDDSWTLQSYTKGYVQNVKDLIYNYMPHYVAVTNPDSLANYTYPDGGMYAIPFGNKPTADTFRTICVRQDLLEEVGMENIASVEDVKEFVAKVHAKYPDMLATMDYVLPAFLLRGIGDRNLTELTTGLWIDEDTGEVVSIADSDEFKQLCELFGEWYNEGVISKDILTNSTSNNVLFESGNYMFWRGTSGTTVYENLPNLKKVIPTAQTAEYFLSPEKPKYKTQYENTAFQIPVTSENAQYVALFIDLMCTAEYVNMFAYGIEGVDYTVENGKVHRINTEELFYDWMMFNANISLFPEAMPDDFIPVYQAWDDGAIRSKKLSVKLSYDDIKNEYAQINAVWSEFAYPMMAGVVSYEEGIAALQSKLAEAGWDKYAENISAQVAAALQ